MTLASSDNDPPQGTNNQRTVVSGGAAIILVVVMMLVRGGKRAVVDEIHGQKAKRPEPQLRAELERERASDVRVQLAETDWSGREIALQTAQATQSRLALPETELDAILQDMWKSKHPDARVFPWQVNIVDWRLTFDWDVKEVRRLLEARAVEIAKTAKGTEN